MDWRAASRCRNSYNVRTGEACASMYIIPVMSNRYLAPPYFLRMGYARVVA